MDLLPDPEQCCVTKRKDPDSDVFIAGINYGINTFQCFVAKTMCAGSMEPDHLQRRSIAHILFVKQKKTGVY